MLLTHMVNCEMANDKICHEIAICFFFIAVKTYIYKFVSEMEFLEQYDQDPLALARQQSNGSSPSSSASENEESDDENGQLNLEIERRAYRLLPRIDYIDMWNDVEFFQRFRLRKETVVYVLSMIHHKLPNNSNRRR